MLAKQSKKAVKLTPDKTKPSPAMDRSAWEEMVFGNRQIVESLLLPRPKALDLMKGPGAQPEPPSILSLDVQLMFGLYTSGPWSCVIEIPSDAFLWDLHETIRTACKFDDDHLFGFYIATASYRGAKHWLNDVDDEPMDLQLNEIWPLKNHYLLHYLYDFGDSWTFQVRRQRKSPFPPVAKTKYPRIVSIEGKRLVQYPNRGW